MLKRIAVIILLILIGWYLIPQDEKNTVTEKTSPGPSVTPVKPMMIKQGELPGAPKNEVLAPLNNQNRTSPPNPVNDIKRYRNFISFQQRKMAQMSPETRAQYLKKMKNHPLIRRNPKILESLQLPPSEK